MIGRNNDTVMIACYNYTLMIAYDNNTKKVMIARDNDTLMIAYDNYSNDTVFHGHMMHNHSICKSWLKVSYQLDGAKSKTK